MNASSTAPPSSSLSASPYVHSLMFTSTPGWSAEKRPSGPGRRIATTLNGAAMLVARRRIPARYEGYVHAAGLVLMLALMAVVMYNDIARIVTS